MKQSILQLVCILLLIQRHTSSNILPHKLVGFGMEKRVLTKYTEVLLSIVDLGDSVSLKQQSELVPKLRMIAQTMGKVHFQGAMTIFNPEFQTLSYHPHQYLRCYKVLSHLNFVFQYLELYMVVVVDYNRALEYFRQLSSSTNDAIEECSLAYLNFFEIENTRECRSQQAKILRDNVIPLIQSVFVVQAKEKAAELIQSFDVDYQNCFNQSLLRKSYKAKDKTEPDRIFTLYKTTFEKFDQILERILTVSYTHLTLPTIYSV
eukprot:TRINITY_DN20212_c0_g1_i1.p1 TRINITY_DN20212_c0_g1~~TRINITY_DN20212_c0_g1_i1.p1  ORF type:complete len:262 (+),score=32.41 TRINITY_DN20212_c0_g1_i1:56-841(+)